MSEATAATSSPGQPSPEAGRDAPAAMGFFATVDCRSATHCRTCRAREAGRPFRAAVVRHFQHADPDPDFECPHGRAWEDPGPFATVQPLNVTPPDPSLADAEREYAEDIRATCARCPHVDTCELGQLARRRPCEARARFQAGVACPTAGVVPWNQWFARRAEQPSIRSEYPR